VTAGEPMAIPRLPLELALKVRNHEATLTQSTDESDQTNVVRLLCVFHVIVLSLTEPLSGW
jgi:hypothetical protein